jgi:putative membrane protein
MKKRLKRFSLVILAAVLVIAVTAIIPAGAEAPKGSQGEGKAISNEFVFLETDPLGNVEKAQVYDWLSVKEKGSFDVRLKKTLDGKTKWQAIKGTVTPKDDGNYIVWKVDTEGAENLLAVTNLDKGMVEEAATRIPLDIRYEYWFDGQKITDPSEITGKSGRFKLQLTLRNTSKEKRKVKYVDPKTGVEKEEEVEVYLPLVIQPYDWDFDNKVFYNLETDPTGIIVYLPDFYRLGWSIPLFPPATEESHTIWVSADVKNFRMPTLTLLVAFILPHTNQADPIPTFKSGLESVYGGVKKLDEGLRQMRSGVGDPATENTLLNGITKIHEGLSKMASANAVPAMKSGLDDKLIPGIRQMYAGIGSETTDGTLLYAASAAAAGLLQIAGGIGSPDTEDTALYAMAAMKEGLESILAGIGSATTPNTLLFATNAVNGGLNGILAGVQQMLAGIGTPTTSNTLLNGLAQIKGGLQQISLGLGTTTTPNTIIYGLDNVATNLNAIATNLQTQIIPAVSGVSAQLKPGTGTTLYDYVNANVGEPQKSYILGNFAAFTTNYLDPAVGGLGLIHSGLTNPDPTQGLIAAVNYINGQLQYIKGQLDTALIPGVDLVSAGLDSPDPAHPGIKQGLQQVAAGIGSSGTSGTLLYAISAITGGLESIAAGIGSATTAETLLYAVDKVTAGMEQMKAGIGSAAADGTLLYALAAMQGGLHRMKQGLASGDPNNPAVLEGLVQISGGLGDVIKGLGSTGTEGTLLYGTYKIKDGLGKLSEGMAKATDEGTSALIKGLEYFLGNINLNLAKVKAIEERAEEFNHFLGDPEGGSGTVRFIYQTKPTYSYKEGGSWVTGLGLALIAGGFFLARKMAG